MKLVHVKLDKKDVQPILDFVDNLLIQTKIFEENTHPNLMQSACEAIVEAMTERMGECMSKMHETRGIVKQLSDGMYESDKAKCCAEQACNKDWTESSACMEPSGSVSNVAREYESNGL